MIQATVRNVSRGGVCVQTEQLISPSSLLVCEIVVSDKPPVSVPTLLEVCWTKKKKRDHNGYLSGLQFLF